MLKKHAKTSIVTLNYVNLAVSRKSSFKDKESGTPASSKYSLTLLLNKQDKQDMQTVRILQNAQDEVMQDAINEGTWLPANKELSIKAFIDADKDNVKDAKTRKWVSPLEAHPELAGFYRLNATRPSQFGRPTVKYLNADGIVEELPEPIIAPEENQLAEAERVQALWNKWVFGGQKALVSLTFSAWSTTIGAGTRALIDNVLIIGGGTRNNGVDFDTDFDEKTIAKAALWRAKHTRFNSAQPEPAQTTADTLTHLTDLQDTQADEEEVDTF